MKNKFFYFTQDTVRFKIYFGGIKICFKKFIPKMKEYTEKYIKNDLAIVAIVKNEAPYIQEWIEYHKLIGFSKFYIYDNDSDDNLEETLKKYINDETVVYCKFSGKCMQLAAYQHAIENYKNENRYMAIIDLDEFIVSPDEENLLNILKNMEEKKKDFGGLAINWCLYGSSGHKQKPQGGGY